LELTAYEQNLPANLEDLSQFILVGREKLTSVRAEIRAIDKLKLAKEVMSQKREEAQMLAEALLDAETRFGDLSKAIPTAPGARTDKTKHEPRDTAVPRSDKPKYEAIKDLGFSKKQAQRFETLADNKDLVERVKDEARENDDIPTRARVLELAQKRKQREVPKDKDFNQYEDFCLRVSKKFTAVIYDVSLLGTDDRHLNAWKEYLDQDMIESHIERINESIPRLLRIQKFLKELSK